jgi:hypothetical protein
MKDKLDRKVILEAYYQRMVRTPSDINEHCATLRRLAEKCEHATEFGVRYGVSTVSLLAGSITGKLSRLVSYDLVDLCGDIFKWLAPTVFDFRIGDSRNITIDRTDLLLIDTVHTEGQLSLELARHSGNVRQWIVIHDTESYGEVGEDNRPGLNPALNRFMSAGGWKISEYYLHNNGLAVLEKR